MKKLLLLGLLFLAVLVVSCAPASLPEGVSPEDLQEATTTKEVVEGESVVPALGCLEGQQGQNGRCLVALGSQCGIDSECASGVCGYNEQDLSVCKEPNQPLGSQCYLYNHQECASGLCGLNEQSEWVCEEPNQPLGSQCGSDKECASILCTPNEQNERVCEEPNQPLGVYCWS